MKTLFGTTTILIDPNVCRRSVYADREGNKQVGM
jgi:hypothetical protein